MPFKRISLCFFIVSCLALLLPTDGVAETWTDSTGQFTVEAEFKGVEGKSIVLVKENGVQITVPIAKLSAESKALAQSLYKKMQPNPVTPAAEDSPKSTIPKRTLPFEAPEPPTLSPMPAFPEGTTLKETVDFIVNQIQAGHLEVLWHALPTEMRSEMESPELRQSVNPFVQQQSQTIKSVETLVFKAIQVLVTKKEFVLGSSMMEQVPPETMPMVTQGYDPAIGIVYELSDLGFLATDLQDFTITALVDHYGPRIGGHLKNLMQLAPAEMVAVAFADMEVEMIDSDNGILKAPKPPGIDQGDFGLGADTDDLLMTRFMGRWIPKDLADAWPSMKEMMENDLEQALDAQQNSEDMQGAVMMAGMMTGLVGGVLDQLLAASSQAEFDQILTQSAGMLGGGALGGGGLGGPGLGGPGFGPGGPGF